MKYRVVFSQAAAEDLEQLFDFALQRELDGETGDLNVPEEATGLWRRDWMHFRDRLLPGVFPPIVPRHQQ